MIGTSLLEYIFIRACIIGLQSVAPLSIIYCLAWLLSHITKVPLPGAIDLPLPFKFWTLAEVIFYVFVNVIYREKLQYEALHPAALARSERKELFQRCNESIPDTEAYLEKWFLGAAKDEIKRDNVKEFFLWAFFNRDGPPGQDDEELEEYVVALEALLGRKIQEGRGNAVCLRLTIDGVGMLHRSILWYLVSPYHQYQLTACLIDTVRWICRLPDLLTLAILWVRLPPNCIPSVLDDLPHATFHPFQDKTVSCQATHLLASPAYLTDQKTGGLRSWYRNRSLPLCQFSCPVRFPPK
jgi:uncharacterized membrane protein YhdT